MYELGIVSTFFYHRGHSGSITVGLQYLFEWVPYLHRDRGIHKIVRSNKSHSSASFNEPWTTITMNLMFNSRTVRQNIFYDRLLQVKRLKKKPSWIRVLQYLLWINHQYYGNNTPEVDDVYQLDDFYISELPKHPSSPLLCNNYSNRLCQWMGTESKAKFRKEELQTVINSCVK